MRIDLATMIRRADRTRQRRIVLPAIVPTKAQETDLYRIYAAVVAKWQAVAGQSVLLTYSATLAAMMRDSVGDVEAKMQEANAGLLRFLGSATRNVEDWVVRTERWHRGRWVADLTPSGVDLTTLLGSGEVTATLEATLAENVALIRSLNDQLRNGISGAVFRGLSNRSTAAQVAKEIRTVTGIGRRRATLIASDQLQKLTSRLDQERQQQAGCVSFEWAHSRKKHPRPEHVARNGQTFRWDSVVGRTDPPGRAIRCGCKARAVLDVAEVEPIRPAPAAKRKRKRKPRAKGGTIYI